MTISEFATSRGRKTGTVSKYIREHKSDFEGHVTREGKSVLLDNVAVSLLDAQYPEPKPVTIIKGIPLEDHYKALQEKDLQIQSLQQSLIQMQQQYQDAMVKVGQLDLIEEQASEVKAELQETRDELIRLRSRSLWQRIRNK